MNFQATYIEQCSDTTNKKCGIQIKAGSRSTRQPVHMILACDTSGSMDEDNRLNSVKRSVTLLLSLLGPEDRLSLVTFADTSKTVMSRVIPSAEDRQAIQYRIDSLNADGSTNLSSALLDARTLVEPASSGRKQGLIVLTDGYANVGVIKEEGLVEIVGRILSESPGLTLTCVAYGVNHNSELMTSLAQTGGGAYNVVKNLEDVATVFGDILGGLVSVAAQGVQIQLPPGAEADTSYRCEKDSAGVTTVYIGDVYADSEITVLLHSNPSKGPLRVKGTDMATLNMIDETVEPTAFSTDNPLVKTIRITELRQRTAEVLKSVANSTGTVQEIDALIASIEQDEAILDHPLKPLLLEDLQEAKKVATAKAPRDLHTTTQMMQHSAYLGMSRGLRSNTRNVPQNPSISPFATRAQTQYASVMRTASQRPEDEENPDEYS
jgi:Mg-chelatase subunit ChlD